MQTQGDRIHQLYHQWLNGETNPADEGELRTLLMENNLSESLYAAMQKVFESTEDDPSFPIEKRQEIAAKIMNMHPATAEASEIVVHRVHFMKTAWFRYAAVILLILAGAATYFFIHTSQPQVEMAQTTPSPLPKQDVLPGSDKAILTLSNGQQVQLNSATSETITDGTLSIENKEGQLIYTQSELAATNTMTTPKGGQYQLTLADGTKVWLNAASSITYPTAFTGKTREVAITGEAYFEVAKNKEKPFIVTTHSDEITVLGTSFNVNAYADEGVVKTSLLEGIVKVGDTNIKPGQAYQDGKVKQADVQQDIAWKNGYFNLENITLEQTMRQFARWYDVEIIYEKGIPKEQLSGKMDRNITLKDALDGLEGVAAHFKLVGRKVYVSPIR